MSLVFFHTAQSNADLFSKELQKRDLPPARHIVRADLLKKATEASVENAQVWTAIEEAMVEAKAQGDSLICTCSTLGPVADELARRGEDAGRSDHFLAKALDILVPDNQYYGFFALAQASMAEALELCEHEACNMVWTVPGALCDHLLATAR